MTVVRIRKQEAEEREEFQEESDARLFFLSSSLPSAIHLCWNVIPELDISTGLAKTRSCFWTYRNPLQSESKELQIPPTNTFSEDCC